jgi:hypothetical protein
MTRYCLRCDCHDVEVERTEHPGTRTVLVPGHCGTCGGPVVAIVMPAAG